MEGSAASWPGDQLSQRCTPAAAMFQSLLFLNLPLSHLSPLNPFVMSKQILL